MFVLVFGIVYLRDPDVFNLSVCVFRRRRRAPLHVFIQMRRARVATSLPSSSLCDDVMCVICGARAERVRLRFGTTERLAVPRPPRTLWTIADGSRFNLFGFKMDGGF